MRKPLSALGALILLSAVGYLFHSGGVNLLDFSTGLALLLTGMAIAVLWWGFKPDIMRWLKKKHAADIAIVKTRSLFGRDKLMEVYSPIHAMIVRVNSELPRETALRLTAGAWMSTSLIDIDIDNISAIFNQHNDKFRDKDLKMWLAIEKEIKEQHGFWMAKDRQEWFDELEAEYDRLTKHMRETR